jgi:L-rhamnose-H+ transport protein
MGPNPLLGIIFHWIGGFAAATTFIPFRGIRRWAWEVYWLIQGIAAWILAPLLFAGLLIPHLMRDIRTAPASAIGFSILWGTFWGVGGLTFGLAVRYLGFALGYAVALGLSTVFGTLIPPIYTGEIATVLHERSGQAILFGVLVCVVAVAVNGAAGLSKERELSPTEKARAGERDFSFGKGLTVAIFAGIMSSFFAFGLKAGDPIAAITRTDLLASNRPDLWQNLPVLVVVLWGGFLTNLIWIAILLIRNRTASQFTGAAGVNPMHPELSDEEPVLKAGLRGLRLPARILIQNYLFAAMAGVIWYFQFFFYSMGQTKMGKYHFSSWALHMASIIIFATLWSLVLREWRGTSRRTRILVTSGLLLLVASTLIIGYGNYLKTLAQ